MPILHEPEYDDQLDELVFLYSDNKIDNWVTTECKWQYDIERWGWRRTLDERHPINVIAFKDIQAAIEFKLRFG